MKRLQYFSSATQARLLNLELDTPDIPNEFDDKENRRPQSGTNQECGDLHFCFGVNSPKFADQGFVFTPTNKESIFDFLPQEKDEDEVADEDRHNTTVSYKFTRQKNPFERTLRDRKPKDMNEYITKLKSMHDNDTSVEGLKSRKLHIMQVLQSLKQVRNLPRPRLQVIRSKALALERPLGYENKKTIIFDLDETLVHCVENPQTDNPHMLLDIKLPYGGKGKAGINIRPHARKCLEYAHAHFEVIVFTASTQTYADVVLDRLDPDKKFIHHRLYRQNCIPVSRIFVKDLRILGRALSDTVIVDNSVHSFGYQIENGIPILGWYDNMEDTELLKLMDYMKVLVNVDDVRDVIRKSFSASAFSQEYVTKYLL